MDCVFIFLIRIVSHDFVIVFVFVFYCNSLDCLLSRAAVAVQILFSLGACGERCSYFLILEKSEQVVGCVCFAVCFVYVFTFCLLFSIFSCNRFLKIDISKFCLNSDKASLALGITFFCDILLIFVGLERL